MHFIQTNRLINRQYNCIDLIKFICAYFVCMIHINPFSGVSFPYSSYIIYALRNGICRIAVPFFLCASGFLLFRKIDSKNIDKKRIMNYCFRLLRLLGIWTVLLFFGHTIHLWYLGGTVIGVVLLSILLLKKVSGHFIAVIAILLYFIGLFGDSYSGFVQIISEKTGASSIYDVVIFFNEDITRIFRLGLFSTLIFIAIGALFAFREIHIRIPIAFLGFFVSILLLVCEAIIIKRFTKPLDNNMYLSLIPASFFLFYIATNVNLPNNPIYITLRKIGVFVFFLHQFFRAVLELVLTAINNAFGTDLSNLLFIITILVTTLISIILVKLSKTEKFIWINYLIS